MWLALVGAHYELCVLLIINEGDGDKEEICRKEQREQHVYHVVIDDEQQRQDAHRQSRPKSPLYPPHAIEQLVFLVEIHHLLLEHLIAPHKQPCICRHQRHIAENAHIVNNVKGTQGKGETRHEKESRNQEYNRKLQQHTTRGYDGRTDENECQHGEHQRLDTADEYHHHTGECLLFTVILHACLKHICNTIGNERSTQAPARRAIFLQRLILAYRDTKKHQRKDYSRDGTCEERKRIVYWHCTSMVWIAKVIKNPKKPNALHKKLCRIVAFRMLCDIPFGSTIVYNWGCQRWHFALREV